MVKGFKEFVMQGSVVDLAVGVVVGAAFGGLVNQFGASFLNPLIALVTGGGVDGGTFTVNEQVFDYGAFVNAIIVFLITLAAIYFVVVVPINKLNERRKLGQESDVDPTPEEQMLVKLDEIAQNTRR